MAKVFSPVTIRRRHGSEGNQIGGPMRTSTKSVYLLLCSFLFFITVSISAYAGAPTNLMKQTIDRVIDILKNKELKKPGKTQERRVEIRKVVGERFDFEEMAKRSLALHWRKRTPEEIKEFVSLFSDLLERTYIKKIESYTDEKILYPDEKIEGDYAVVKTKVITKKNVEVPIEYRLLNENGYWKVYDVVVEGVSLINNYRSQFNDIIRRNSYEELVQRLKNKEQEELFKKIE
jgi:phospholipid transport system substrate-binding protein